MNGLSQKVSDQLLILFLGALVSAVCTGIGLWMSVIKDNITRSEASIMIQEFSPYVKDRSFVMLRFDKLEQGQERIEKKLDAVLASRLR